MNDLPWSLRTTTAPLGIAGRVSDAKQIRDAGGVRLHICPATGNAPTRMTRASWERLCAATQRKSLERECIDKNQAQLMRMTRRLNVCAWCRGEILPRGLEFIDAAEMAAMIKPKEEEPMAKQSKLGVCENCGDKGALTASFGRRVCTACLKIRSGVNSHIERVAAAARDMGRAPELLAALVPDGGGLAIKVTADLLQEISGIVGYDGEDPDELVAAVRKAAALGAHQLTSEAEAGALRTIAGIVGYEGTDGKMLVEAVRKRVLTCASCDAEDVLAEIREITGYVPEQGDKGLADMVRRLVEWPSVDCGKCTTLRGDLLRACGLEMDDTEDGDGWDTAAAAAIQTIGDLEGRNILLKQRIDHLHEILSIAHRDAEHLRAKLQDCLDANDSLVHEVSNVRNMVAIGESQLAKLRAELTIAEQARDEYEQRAVRAEQNVKALEADLRNAENAPDPCANSTYLLDVALAVIREEPVPAVQIASLIEAARRAA